MPWFVNGENVSAELVAAEAARLRPSYRRAFPDQAEDERERQLLEWARENVNEHILIRQAAELRVPRPTAETVHRAYKRFVEEQGGEALVAAQAAGAGLTHDDVVLDIERNLRVEALLQTVHAALPEPTDEEARAYHEKHQEELASTEIVRASHLVVHVHEERSEQDARARIEQAAGKLAGGAIFEDVVNAYSDCPDNDGDLGWFTRGEMVEEFEEVVFGLRPGQVSGIITTPFGFHIARLVEHRPAQPVSFEQVRDEVLRRLWDEQRSRAVESLLDSLRAEAEIVETKAAE